MRTNIVSLALTSLLTATVGLAQQAPPQPAPDPGQPGVTFRAEVNYVEVDARVVDAQGNFVSGLQQGDFQILEDGKPQPISVFSLVNLPVERAARPLFASKPIEPDVQTNISGINGRVYLIVLDDLHTHPLRGARVKQAARQFIERYLSVNDVAAVVHTSGRTDGAQEFTGNPRLLLHAVDKFMGRKLRSALLGRLDQEQRSRDTRQPGDRIDDPDAAERGHHARNTFDSIKGFADLMAGVRGRRKALVYFSEGVDYDITDPFTNTDATTVMDASRDAIAAATRANVAIYGIDVRGLGAGADDAMEVQSFPQDPTLGLDSSAQSREVRMGQDSLRVLADQTGGFAAVNTNDIGGAFHRLVDENSAYYVLGYYPANERRDGRFRKLEVRVNQPGLQVRARRGYVAPRGRVQDTKLAGPNAASAELREAMSSPVPLGGLPLATTASVFKGPDKNGSVVISTLIGGRDLSLIEKDGTFRNDVEIAFVAVDSKGKSFAGDRNTLNMNFKPDTLARVRAAGFRVISSMDLPPGRYQLRIAVREANTRRSGSVLYDLEVPDFAKDPISMSHIALTSAASGFAPTARPKDPLLKILPAPLTSYRDFSQADELALFAEVYETGGGPAHKVEIAATLKAEGGQTVFQTREERDSSELQGSSGGYGFNARIPLKGVAPGLYVLRVEAQSRIADRKMVSRETVVHVIATPQAARPGATAAGGVIPLPPSTVAGPPQAPPPPVPAAPRAPVAAPGPIAMTTINSDMMSGITRPQQSVARTAAEWQTLWSQHVLGRPAPVVDFTKQMVVAVFLGSRSSSGYAVQITGVRKDGNTLVVQWAERKPEPGMMAAQVMTSPSHIATVPRHVGDLRFEKVEP
ncbi:MAG TPA: VWA domain-containing protein [Vicinamibacterales bacterium]|nr:VWA domain-containing protein [Vicinamibacterales bacterium]